MQEHPWVTKNGTDPLLSKEENCANLIEPPTKMEVNHAITGNFKNLMVVVGLIFFPPEFSFKAYPLSSSDESCQ
jgi:hypothetical protein